MVKFLKFLKFSFLNPWNNNKNIWINTIDLNTKIAQAYAAGRDDAAKNIKYQIEESCGRIHEIISGVRYELRAEVEELELIPPTKVSCGKTNTLDATGKIVEKTVTLKQYGLSVHFGPIHTSVRLAYFNQEEWDKDYSAKRER